jgi:hypothetical protein
MRTSLFRQNLLEAQHRVVNPEKGRAGMRWITSQKAVQAFRQASFTERKSIDSIDSVVSGRQANWITHRSVAAG